MSHSLWFIVYESYNEGIWMKTSLSWRRNFSFVSLSIVSASSRWRFLSGEPFSSSDPGLKASILKYCIRIILFIQNKQKVNKNNFNTSYESWFLLRERDLVNPNGQRANFKSLRIRMRFALEFLHIDLNNISALVSAIFLRLLWFM